MTSRSPAVGEAAARLGARAQSEVPVGPRTTYRVGGAAALFCVIEDEETLDAVSDAVRATGTEVLVLGKGSNVLLTDAGFDGLVVALGERFAESNVDGTTVRAGGAASLPVLARQTAAGSLTGFEWAVGVPGAIGGAVRMNAGGHGSDMAACLLRVRVRDLTTGEDVVMAAADLDLGYRHSAIAPGQVVCWAEIGLERGDRARSEGEIREIVRWRRANQPGGQNAGSVFANPPGDSAGRLIEAAGARGLRIGSAEVSPKHANFIQADPDGSADDVWRLMVEIRRRVFDHAGVVLQPENRLIGFEPLPAP